MTMPASRQGAHQKAHQGAHQAAHQRANQGARRGARQGARQAGFTLLEILVSLAVLAAILAGLAQATQFGIRAWNSQLATVGRNADLDNVDRSLRMLLGRMLPPAAPDRPSMVGSADSLRFVSELPPGAPVADTRMAAITLLVQDGALRLRWSEQPHARLLGPPPPVHDDVLMQGVKALALSYRSRSGQWSDSWAIASLPQLIRIHLDFAPGSTRRWPDILVSPMRDSISETGE